MRPAGGFAMVTCEELWILGGQATLRESRLSHGTATLEGADLVATDALDEELLSVTRGELDRVRELLPRPDDALTARVVVTGCRPGAALRLEAVIVLTSGRLALVSDPDHAAADCARLLQIAALPAEVDLDDRTLPVVWRHGTGSVLLHEAAGHPSEHGHVPLEWPPWLSVTDKPRLAIDDCGRLPSPANLLAGEPPRSLRRAGFADVPLPRLAHVVVRQNDAPFETPRRRIEVLLTDGGRYEPLTEQVVVFISAADLVEGKQAVRLRPFVLAAPRHAVARGLLGATGQPARYPGVVCSVEGQEIVVGSEAPDLLTRF